MSSQDFKTQPTVEFLQILARGNLKQNRWKAVRLWVILRSIYGQPTDPVLLQLPQKFNYETWRNSFFIDAEKNHQRDKHPKIHDSKCPCGKSLTQWLFEKESDLTVDPDEWKEDFLQLYPLNETELQQILESEKINPGRPQEKHTKTQPNNTIKSHLFAVTGRTLQNDFNTLTELGYLTEHNKFYHKVENLPEFNTVQTQVETQYITKENLTEIASNYLQPIEGVQRFFLDIEYVISNDKSDQVGDLQEQLKEIWSNNPVQPILIEYDSASFGIEGKRITYPVCIYYFQRASYLCAWGQTPKKKSELGWYNYRLDRINSLEELSWDNSSIPQELQSKSEQNQLPQPDEIKEAMSEAWGFDFYRPQDLMLIRFEKDFHDNYIEKTYRHDTFHQIESRKELINLQKTTGNNPRRTKFFPKDSN